MTEEFQTVDVELADKIGEVVNGENAQAATLAMLAIIATHIVRVTPCCDLCRLKAVAQTGVLLSELVDGMTIADDEVIH